MPKLEVGRMIWFWRKDVETKKGGLTNPFTPGFGGQVPPLIAGRDSEKTQVLDQVGGILRGGHNARDVVLIGPRGTGKTTLLNWLNQHIEGERKIGSLPSKVRAVGPISNIGDPSRMDLLFKASSIFSRFDAVEVGIEVVRSKLVFKDDKYFKSIGTIARQTKRSPIAVMIDEAHELSSAQIQMLFHITQDSRNSGSSVIVAMAGTPELRKKLDKAQATFVERAKEIDIGPLHKDAAREAIADPLKDFGGIGITEKALQAVVEDAQQYPYFIQLWGQALWNHATAAELSILDEGSVEKCGKEVWKERNALYEKRYNRWKPEERKFLAEIGGKIKQGVRLDQEGLEVIGAEFLEREGIDPKKASRYVARMIDEGVVWKRQEETEYGPGIPSFLSYLVTRRERHDRKMKEAQDLER